MAAGVDKNRVLSNDGNTLRGSRFFGSGDSFKLSGRPLALDTCCHLLTLSTWPVADRLVVLLAPQAYQHCLWTSPSWSWCLTSSAACTLRWCFQPWRTTTARG